MQGWRRDLPSVAAARPCHRLQDTKESIQLRSQALEESSATEEGLPGWPQTGLASDKMPIDGRQQCCTPRTRGRGFAGIQPPGAGRHSFRGWVDTAPLIAQPLSLAQRRGQVLKQSPEMLFQILLPERTTC